MKKRYLVEFDTCTTTPIIVEALSEREAVDLARMGHGEAGQAWYSETTKLRARRITTVSSLNRGMKP